MSSNLIKKKRLLSILAIIIGLPFAIASASSQNLIMGVLWGSVFCFGIDGLIESFSEISQKRKTQIISTIKEKLND